MATAAWRWEVEKTVEQRLERLEVHVEHVQADVTEIKGKLGEMDVRLTTQIKEVDQRLTGKIEDLDKKLSGKIDSLLQLVNDLKVGRYADRVWFLLMSAGLLCVLAKAFKWV